MAAVKGIMKGVIDLVYRHKNKTIIADFKTDKPGKKAAKERENKYKIQKTIYREAVSKILNIPDPEIKLIFLRTRGRC